jgi:hypothetical protein
VSGKLSSLVEADPVLMIYALQHLGEGVPTNPHDLFYSQNLLRLRREIFAKLATIALGLDPLRQLTPDKLDQLERLWTKQMLDDESLRKALLDLPGQDVDILRKKLHDPQPAVRSLAMHLIAARRLPLEADLIDLLTDPGTRSTAHDALVRLARGADFGPIPGASRRSVDRSIEKWRQWLALQQSESPEMLAKEAAIAAAGKHAKVAPLDIVPLSLTHDDRPDPLPEVAKRCDELVNAKGDEQRSVLTRLRDTCSTRARAAHRPVCPHAPARHQGHR